MPSQLNPTPSANDALNLIKKLGIFWHDVDVNAIPRHAVSSLIIVLATNPSLKFKDCFPKFFGSSVIYNNEHLVTFLNAYDYRSSQ